VRKTTRILTDIRIDQCELWRQETRFLPGQRWNGLIGTLLHAFHVALNWHRYDVLITANVRSAASFGLVRRLLPVRAPSIMVLELRMDDPRSSLKWKAKRFLQRVAFRGVARICVSARREIAVYSDRLNLDPEIFRFVPWHTNVEDPRVVPASGGYAFSAGRTGRDWNTLSRALEGLPIEAVVVCSGESATGVAFPSNTKVFHDIPYDEYRKLLLGARVVVVALEEHVYSSGQVAFLEAMALGKPVVVTRCVGSEDYIQHDRNGLLVAVNDPNELRDAILNVITCPSLEQMLRDEALKSVRDQHTFDRYVATVLQLARSI
jgi:hypothetical protein